MKKAILITTPLAALPLRAEVTFTKDVAPIIFNHCAGCHRPDEAAPFALLNYNDVRKRARLIVRVTEDRVMPPWHADRRYGTFRNELSLTEQEIDTIASWVAAGAREGDSAELPTLPVFSEGWQIGVPDIVFEMPSDFHVPSTGTVDYQYFDVPTNFAEDRWM